MRLSPHTARALKNAPLKNKDAAWFKSKPDLRDTDLRADSHSDGRIQRSMGSCTNGLRRRHLLCFLHRFHRWSRVRAPTRSLLRFRRGDVVQPGDATSIRPITGRLSLSPSSFADHTIRLSYEIPSCDQGHDRFITFRICTTHGLGFASPPVTVLSASRELGTLEPATYLLVKLVSIFSSCRSRRLSAIYFR